MADHTENCGQIGAADGVNQRFGAHERRENQLSQMNRDKTLAHIPHRGQQRRQLAIGAQNVGHSGVAAAMETDVIVIKQFGDHQAKEQTAQQISFQRGQSTGDNKLYGHE